jgi:CD109 antigen
MEKPIKLYSMYVFYIRRSNVSKIDFHLQLKNQPEGNYNLEVIGEGETGDKFYMFRKLNMNTKRSSVFVQTDKSIYKPADNVQFRVLVLNSEMKPVENVNVSVFISDGAQNRVKQFDGVHLTKGVFTNELQLSDLPVMGTWSINVLVNNEKAHSKNFDVAEYTLPKFEVQIDANPDANYKDGKIRATVKAKYTFGKVAKGNATVTAEIYQPYHWWRSEPERKNVSKSVEVDGKKPVEFDIENELGIKDQKYEKQIKLFATFTEELTGKEQNATAMVTIHITPHTIELVKSADSFKPGLPFSVSAFVKFHDKEVPVSDKHNPVKFTLKFYYDVMRNCTRRKYLNQNPWDYRNPPSAYMNETYDCREEKNYEEKQEVFLVNGESKINIEISSNATRFDVIAKYLETEGSSSYIRKAESRNNEYIHAKLVTENPVLSQKVKIDVFASKPLKDLTYQVIGKADLTLSETIQVPNEKSFQIEFSPTLAMIPKAKVVVFYVTNDGEIVSDLVPIEFGNELRNFIDIDLSKEQAKPGEQLDIVISSNANSFVGLLGIDQSVLLLKKGNDIEKSTVFAELESYNDPTSYNYDWSRDYDRKYFRDFESSHVVILTNAKTEHCK